MEKLHYGDIYIVKFCIICIMNATDAWHQNIILTNLTSDIRQSHETSKGSHKLCFNCCSNLSKSLMLARLAVMPGRGFPGCLPSHAEWCSIIALCPPPAAASSSSTAAYWGSLYKNCGTAVSVTSQYSHCVASMHLSTWRLHTKPVFRTLVGTLTINWYLFKCV